MLAITNKSTKDRWGAVRLGGGSTSRGFLGSVLRRFMRKAQNKKTSIEKSVFGLKRKRIRDIWPQGSKTKKNGSFRGKRSVPHTKSSSIFLVAVSKQ